MATILVDVDGVVADLCTNWLAFYNRDYNDSVQLEQITEWDIHKFLKPECGTKMYEYLKDPSIYDEVKPIPGAQEAIEYLRIHGEKIAYLTSGFFTSKAEWLHRHGFLLGSWQFAKDIVVASDKSLIHGDVLIDDGLHNITDPERSILFDQPWNQEAPAEYRRAHSWQDVIFILEKAFQIPKG